MVGAHTRTPCRCRCLSKKLEILPIPYHYTCICDFCESYNLRITNGYIKHKMIHKYTWEQHTRELKSVIDYIIVKQK